MRWHQLVICRSFGYSCCLQLRTLCVKRNNTEHCALRVNSRPARSAGDEFSAVAGYLDGTLLIHAGHHAVDRGAAGAKAVYRVASVFIAKGHATYD